MKIYVLLCCANGEHDDPEVFPTGKDALVQMRKDYEKVLEWNKDVLTEDNHEYCVPDAWIECMDHTYYWAVREIETI